MSVAVALFTRDLRVHDNPMLVAAAEAQHVVPLFVVDHAIAGPPNRAGFLHESLVDLDVALRARGAGLVVRHGDPETAVARLVADTGATEVHVADDVSRFARARLRRLTAATGAHGAVVHAWPGVTVVPPGVLAPAGGDAYRVFGAYWRRWQHVVLRELEAPPRALRLPGGVTATGPPALADLAHGSERSPDRIVGGERAGRSRLERWLGTGPGTIEGYADGGHDDLAADATSHLSADLHLGTVSPREVVARLDVAAPGHAAFARQLCWRDFHHQLTVVHGDVRSRPLRDRGDRWRDDPEAFAAWTSGTTGFPLVDAGMRQLLATGWMHNRARMTVASLLAKTLHLDWRLGERHFDRWLVDGDVANNAWNWQWVAGVGTDSRPNRVLNPVRQARRFDPTGAYVRRWVPELRGVDDRAVFEPWEAVGFDRIGYPPPIVDLAEGRARFLAARGR